MVGSHTMKRLVRIVVRLQSSFNPLMVESSLFLHSLTHSLEVRQVKWSEGSQQRRPGQLGTPENTSSIAGGLVLS